MLSMFHTVSQLFWCCSFVGIPFCSISYFNTQIALHFGAISILFYGMNPWLDFFKYIDEIRQQCHVIYQVNDGGRSGAKQIEQDNLSEL